MSTLLTLEGVGVRRGDRAVLDGVDLRLAKGELVALVGRNGAGKTTLLRVAAGVLAPEHGAVTLTGRPMTTRTRREIAREVAYLPQAELGEGVELTVSELVALGRAPWGSAFSPLTGNDRAAIERAVRDVDLVALSERALPSLSAGERQRALLGRVFAHESPVLLLDEPTASLDPAHALELLAAVRRRVGTEGCALVAMHDLFLVARTTDRVIVLDGAKILRDGAPADVLDEATLSAALGVDGRIERDGDELVMRARFHREPPR